MSAIEGMFQNGYSGNQQKVAGTNNIGPVRTPARNNQRARTVRDRRANEIQFPRHIPRPRNSWIIYRSDKTRELRDMDPSLTASDICKSFCLRILKTLANYRSPHHLSSLGRGAASYQSAVSAEGSGGGKRSHGYVPRLPLSGSAPYPSPPQGRCHDVLGLSCQRCQPEQ